MKNDNVFIRIATVEDAKQLLEIYSPYVTSTAVSFEYEVPTVEEFRRRIVRTLEKYPYLVAEIGDKIVGYAYAGPFVGRAAYGWSVEMSIYLDMNQRRQGIGRMLYSEMEKILKKMNVLNLNACIGYPDVEDEYLTFDSVEFHKHMGYSMVGKFYKSGYKFKRWYNMVWMEKIIGEHVENQPDVIWFETNYEFVNKRPACFFKV